MRPAQRCIPMPPELSLREAVRGYASAFRTKLSRPREIQERMLRQILCANASSEFGKHYGFADIQDWQTYASRVPVHRYEDVAPWITRIAQGEANVLATDSVIAFEQTGGSSAGRKLIPYTASGLAAFQRGLLPWLDDLFANYPCMSDGTFYWSISPACRASDNTPGGIPVGMLNDAAYFGPQVGEAISSCLAVPAEVGRITDVSTWRELTLLHLFGNENLAMISVWSPSFLTELLRSAVANRSWLASSLASSKERAHLIEEALGSSPPDYRALWPRLCIVSCWDQASAAPMAQELRQQFPGVQIQGKGLLATEGMMSIPLAGCEYPVLALDSGFFEFQGEDDELVLADQLQSGADYRILLTTHSGLYRFAIGDVVRVRGFASRTPMLEFIGRYDAGSDLCGEKLTDAFVMGKLGVLNLLFAMMAPNGCDTRPGYVVILDEKEVSPATAAEIAAGLDRDLSDNPQYAYARQLGQLAPVTPLRCSQPLTSWMEYCVASKGQRLGDIKLPALLKDASWTMWARIVDTA